jgi:hypothetical protein
MCTLATAATRADECKLKGIRPGSLVVDLELTVRHHKCPSLPFSALTCPFLCLPCSLLLADLCMGGTWRGVGSGPQRPPAPHIANLPSLHVHAGAERGPGAGGQRRPGAGAGVCGLTGAAGGAGSGHTRGPGTTGGAARAIPLPYTSPHLVEWLGPPKPRRLLVLIGPPHGPPSNLTPSLPHPHLTLKTLLVPARAPAQVASNPAVMFDQQLLGDDGGDSGDGTIPVLSFTQKVGWPCWRLWSLRARLPGCLGEARPGLHGTSTSPLPIHRLAILPTPVSPPRSPCRSTRNHLALPRTRTPPRWSCPRPRRPVRPVRHLARPARHRAPPQALALPRWRGRRASAEAPEHSAAMRPPAPRPVEEGRGSASASWPVWPRRAWWVSGSLRP